MGASFLTKTLLLSLEVLLFMTRYFLFVMYKKLNLTYQCFELYLIFSVSSTSQYSPYVLKCLGGFIFTNAATSNSLMSTPGGSREGATAYK